MILIEATQGSDAWHAERNKPNTFNASEANALMGTSKYLTRTDLLKQKKTGITPFVSDAQQRLFDRGHEAENTARIIAEKIVDQDFYPTVGYVEVDDMRLLASFDGITFDESIVFEHKLWNESLAESVRGGVIPDSHLWQLEQQLLVSGAQKVLFMVSDGTEQNCEWCYYESQPEAGATLIAAWKQFQKDLEGYQPEPEVIPAKAEPVMALPTLAINVGGSISIQSNLDKFGERLKSFIEETNAKPETDQDFANLEQACKVLKDAEDALKQAESNALAQTASVDEMRRTVAYLADMARNNRLTFEKLVKSEKENRKAQIVFSAKSELNDYMNVIQSKLPKVIVFGVNQPNFADAIKGKKTLASMQDAVNTMLANAKIEADALARELREKHTWYIENASEYSFLFSDLSGLIYKLTDDFKAVANNRISQHKEQERIKAEAAAKAQAEREERIRKEAEEKARREEQQRINAEQAANKMAEEQAKSDQEYRERLERENQAELEHAAQKANEKRIVDNVDTREQNGSNQTSTVQAVDVQPVAEQNKPVRDVDYHEKHRIEIIKLTSYYFDITIYDAEQWLITEFGKNVVG